MRVAKSGRHLGQQRADQWAVTQSQRVSLVCEHDEDRQGVIEAGPWHSTTAASIRRHVAGRAENGMYAEPFEATNPCSHDVVSSLPYDAPLRDLLSDGSIGTVLTSAPSGTAVHRVPFRLRTGLRARTTTTERVTSIHRGRRRKSVANKPRSARHIRLTCADNRPRREGVANTSRSACTIRHADGASGSAVLHVWPPTGVRSMTFPLWSASAEGPLQDCKLQRRRPAHRHDVYRRLLPGMEGGSRGGTTSCG